MALTNCDLIFLLLVYTKIGLVNLKCLNLLSNGQYCLMIPMALAADVVNLVMKANLFLPLYLLLGFSVFVDSQ